MILPTGIQAILCDLDGVLYVGDAVIPGAPAAIERLRDSGLALRFLTNTTTKPRRAVAKKLTALGFTAAMDEILTAPRAAAEYLRRTGRTRCHLVMRDSLMAEFSDLKVPGDDVDAVVIGDIGSTWDHALLQRIFTMIMGGAELVALHRGRYHQAADGLALDIGAYVAGLEYVTGQTATVCGKPSPAFFQAALDDLGLPAEQVAIVGDDIESDVGGGQACGLHGVLVRTGKYRKELADRSRVRPDTVAADITEVAGLIG